MDVSVIIPTYNEEKYLPYLLKSLRKQTKKPNEIIIADHNSTDSTLVIIKKYSKILPIKKTQGKLPAKARNHGALKSTVGDNDLLFFFDADVVLEKDFIEKFTNELERRKLDCATCFNIPFYRLGEMGYSNFMIRLTDNITYFVHNRGLIMSNIINFQFATATCIAIKKKYFRKLKGFNTSLKMFEDADFVRRAAKICRYGVVRDAHVLISTRRFDRYGHVLFALKMGCCGVLTLFFHKFLKYGYFQFDYFKKEVFHRKK